MGVFDVKANDGSKFEMEHLHKMTMTEESPFYGMVYWYTGRYGKNVERKMTVFLDKINKSILFVPKMKMDTTLTIDGEKISEFVFDNTQAKKHIKFFYSPDAYTKDYLFTDEWEYPGQSGCKWNTELKRGDPSWSGCTTTTSTWSCWTRSLWPCGRRTTRSHSCTSTTTCCSSGRGSPCARSSLVATVTLVPRSTPSSTS